ncbi:MAG: MFS transporter [Acetobacteraceae bacterium]|nr:MFS transporter [Acetobacteraceae bacterium]
MGNDAVDEGAPGSPRQYLAPWYLAYLILSLITSGMLPFLLPLMVASTTRDLGHIAYVIGAYNAGLLPAPLLGLLAERYQLFRPVFFGGFGALSLGLGAATGSSALGSWVPLAVVCGFGAGAVATVAPLFVFHFAPKSEWNPRIGWLQSFSGAGQLAGLLIAGLIARGPLAYGLWLAAALSALAIVVGHLGLPSDGRPHGMRLPSLAWSQLMGGFHSGPPVGGILHHSHHLQREALTRLPRALSGEFGRFLSAWAAINFGVAPFFAYYPLIMKSSYGILPATTSLLYALAAGLGIGLFALAGRVSQRHGNRLVFRFGLAVRIAGFAVLAALTLASFSNAPALAVLGFLFVVLAWPILSVSGTGLAASLSPIGEGPAMGLLAASSAMATLLGTVLAGPLVQAFGYGVVSPIAVVGLLSAALLTGKIGRQIGFAGEDDSANISVESAQPGANAALSSHRSSEIPGIRSRP